MDKAATYTVKKTKLTQPIEGKYSALSIAKYLLSLDLKREYFTLNWMKPKEGWESIPREGSFRLNKMLHICQMLYCAKYKKPLFKEQMLAFEHGGVVEGIRTSFVDLYNLIGKEKSDLERNDKQFIDQVFAYFRQEDNERLGSFSHDDPAWKLGKEQGNLQVMPLDDKLINYYADFLDDLLEEVIEK